MHKSKSSLSASSSPSKAPGTGTGKRPSVSMHPPRRESTAARPPPRPDMKTRAYSASAVPKQDADGADELDREEITDDSFFQRYHFPQPVETAKDETSEHSLDSSSDTEGPLSPTHNKYRQPSGDVESESSSGVSAIACAGPSPH